MLDRPSAPHSIGIEAQSQGLIAALLSANETPKIEENVNPLYIQDNNPLIITVIPTSDVLQRPLEIHLKKEKDIQATLAFQAEPLLPYPVEEALLQKIILEKRGDGTSLSILAVRKERMQAHLEAFHEFNPEVVTTLPIALTAFATKYTPQEEPLLVLHLGHQETTCLLVQHDYPIAAQACRSLLTESHIPELLRTVLSLSKQAQAVKVLISGEGIDDKQLVKTLEETLDQEVITHPLGKNAVSIGAGLTVQENYSGISVDFRKEEFAYPHPWKRYQKPLALYLGLCAAIAFSMFLFGKAYLNYQEDRLKQEYIALLADSGKAYTLFEQESGLVDDSVMSPKELTLEDVDTRLTLLERHINATPNLFPLQPNTPFVSDLLAWLSSHPIVNSGEGLTLESLSYSMVKRPDQTKKNEKYKIKVDLEFSSPTPKQAREFHDALVTPNDLVDPKSEIKWSSNRGHYRTSFFLKDKTNYRTR